MSVQWAETRKWLLVGLGLVIAWGAFVTSQGPRFGGAGEAPDLKGTALAFPAEFNWKMNGLDGSSVEFAKFRGRPILLNIWATWCPPCVEEMPTLARLASNPRIKEKDVAVVCVSMDDSLDTVRKFVADKGWGMTILHSTSLPPVFQTDGIPATFLIAPDGRVAATTVGSARWDDPSVVAFLEKLSTP
ncbi:TlpA family protein disulfide reductase [Tundrisphaera lichenicola]|uniref:TlpA family protein disulfide reductase n=1 Tax=Tundrisphaera lichenicola TaxID=2029860 RepID=UPI003EBA0853